MMTAFSLALFLHQNSSDPKDTRTPINTIFFTKQNNANPIFINPYHIYIYKYLMQNNAKFNANPIFINPYYYYIYKALCK